jgi:hypothetical protein
MGRDHLQELYVDGRITLKWTTEEIRLIPVAPL